MVDQDRNRAAKRHVNAVQSDYYDGIPVQSLQREISGNQSQQSTNGLPAVLREPIAGTRINPLLFSRFQGISAPISNGLGLKFYPKTHQPNTCPTDSCLTTLHCRISSSYTRNTSNFEALMTESKFMTGRTICLPSASFALIRMSFFHTTIFCAGRARSMHEPHQLVTLQS